MVIRYNAIPIWNWSSWFITDCTWWNSSFSDCFIAILAQAEIIKTVIDVEANTRSIEIIQDLKTHNFYLTKKSCYNGNENGNENLR